MSFISIRGAPDRVFGRGGRAVFIEFKAPGEEPTRQQWKRQEELAVHFGFEVYWVDNIDDARELLDLTEKAYG